MMDKIDLEDAAGCFVLLYPVFLVLFVFCSIFFLKYRILRTINFWFLNVNMILCIAKRKTD